MNILTYELSIAIAGIFSAIAAISIAIFAIISANTAKTQTESIKTQTESIKTQTDILQKQFLTSHRPWIGVDPGITSLQEKKLLVVKYKNFGTTSAFSVIERHGYTEDLPKRDIIINVQSNKSNPSVILPQQKREFLFQIDNSKLTDVHTKNTKLHLWFIIDYEFNENQHGQYGGIAEYQDLGRGIGNFEVMDEWVK